MATANDPPASPESGQPSEATPIAAPKDDPTQQGTEQSSETKKDTQKAKSPVEPQTRQVDYGPKLVDGVSQIKDWLQDRGAKPKHVTAPPPGIDGIIAELIEWRVIFVSCEDEDCLEAAGYEIVEDPRLAHTRQWILDGQGLQSKADFALLLRELPGLPGPRGEEKYPQLLLIKATLPKFFQTVLDDVLCLNNAMEWLRCRDSFIVCLVHPRVTAHIEIPPTHSAFRHWPVTAPTRSKAPANANAPSATPPFADFINKGLYVERAALFTTAFLGELSRRDFVRVMEILLQGEKEVPSHSAPPVVTTNGGDEKSIERTASDVWRDQMAAVLKDVGLELNVPKQTVRFSGDFAELARDAFWKHLEGPRPFFAKLCETLFFAPKMSEPLQGSLLEAAFTMVVRDPDEFGADWLEKLINRFIKEERAFVARAGEDILLHALLSRVGAETRDRFFTRMALLCETLYPDPDARQPVEELFDRLLRRGDHVPVRELVVRLRSVKGFGYFSWLRRLLNEGESEVKPTVLQHLIDQSAVAPERCAAILSEVRHWLPSSGSTQQISQAQLYCLPFPVALVYRLQEVFDRQQRRGTPPRFPLPLAEGNADPGQWLADWLVHEKLADGLTALAHEPVPASEPFIAEVLERVTLMATNVAPEDLAHQEGFRLRDLVHARVPQKRWLRICQRWNERATELKLALFGLPKDLACKPEREQLQLNLKIVHRLRNSRLGDNIHPNNPK